MGSVKDLEVIKKPKKNEKGIGRFHFSDRYSVFDWGEMPDHIKNKGAALCIMGAYFFEKIEEKNIGTHYRGLISKEKNLIDLKNLKKPTSTMEIDLLRVFEPQYVVGQYDYSKYEELLEKQEGNFLIPLEIIYRNGLPQGSSVFRRLNSGDMSLNDFGLGKKPKPGKKLDHPIFDVSTKLEKKDRYIKWNEAKEIASLTDEEIEKIKGTLKIVNETISKEVKKINLKNEDGKIELGFDEERKIIVVDVFGTLDECRFTYEGTQISKEIARKYYKKTDWYQEVKEAQEEAKEKGVKNWKDLCDKEPPKMDEEVKKTLSQLYMSTANSLIDHNLFETPPLEKVVKKYRSLKEDLI